MSIEMLRSWAMLCNCFTVRWPLMVTWPLSSCSNSFRWASIPWGSLFLDCCVCIVCTLGLVNVSTHNSTCTAWQINTTLYHQFVTKVTQFLVCWVHYIVKLFSMGCMSFNFQLFYCHFPNCQIWLLNIFWHKEILCILQAKSSITDLHNWVMLC